MTDQKRSAEGIPFPVQLQLPEIPVPPYLERAERVWERSQDRLFVRNIARWGFGIAALLGLAELIGRLFSTKIASWPWLTLVVWVLPAIAALIAWIMAGQKISAAAAQFGGLARLRQLQQLLRAIVRYSELRQRYVACGIHAHDERCFGLRPACMSLADFCLPPAEQGQPFDSHLRSAVECLNEAARVLY